MAYIQPIEKYTRKQPKKSYLSRRPDIDDIFDDLEKLLDFCRFNLLPYNPADLYNRNSKIWQRYLYTLRVEKRKEQATKK